MKLLPQALVAVLLIAAPLPSLAASYVIDASHSSAQFTVRHMMVSNVRGEFRKISGKVDIDEKDITKSTVEATIDVASIDTREPKRDEHLRSADFFDVQKFPTITFKSKSVKRAGGNKLKVEGDLTIHGVTRTVVLDLDGLSPELKDPWGSLRRGAMATTKVSRKDFGLKWNETLESGGVLVGDEVGITIDVQLERAQPSLGAQGN